jgi:putative transposase
VDDFLSSSDFGSLATMAPNQPLHRKQVKHYDEPGHCHELTFSCYLRMPLLTNDQWRSMLSEAIDRAIERYAYRLVSFVYMPEQVHLIVLPTHPDSQTAALLKAIKRPFSWRIKSLLVASDSPLLRTLMVRQRPGVTTFRFWQEGSGYDRNLMEVHTVLAAIEYVHLNPVRRGLVSRATDWRWSSARAYLGHSEEADAALPAVSGLPAAWINHG